MVPSHSVWPAQRRRGRIADRGGGLQGGLSRTSRGGQKKERNQRWLIPLLPDRPAKQVLFPGEFRPLLGHPMRRGTGSRSVRCRACLPIETVALATKQRFGGGS